MAYNQLRNHKNNVSNNGQVPLPSVINKQPLLANVNKKHIDPIKKEEYETYIKDKDLFKLTRLYFFNKPLSTNLEVIQKQRHVDRIVKESSNIKIYSTPIKGNPIVSDLGDKSTFYHDKDTKPIESMNKKIEEIFDTPLEYNKKLYNLEHITISNTYDNNNTAVLTYKDKDSKIIITLKQDEKINMKEKGRGILGYKGWFSGGKSRRSKKSKKRHTRKRRN